MNTPHPIPERGTDSGRVPLYPTTIVVAGLGRCGTSLVMQMLSAAGVPCIGAAPDFEDMRVAHGPIDPLWFVSLRGRAVKVIDPHLNPPPQFGAFRAIWLTRDLDEQAKSQAKFATVMLGAQRANRATLRKWARKLRDEQRLALTALGAHPRIDVTFEQLLNLSDVTVGRLCNFLRPTFGDLNPHAMLGAIRPRSADCAPGLDMEAALVEARA